VCICSTIGKHTLACSRHEMECFYCRIALIESASELVCCTVQRFHLSSEYHHPSVEHLATHQGISLGGKIVPLTPGVGNLRPAGQIRPGKRNHPARSPFTQCSNCMARLVVLYFMNLPSLQHLVLYTYEELLMRNRTVL